MGGPCFVQRSAPDGKIELDTAPDCTDNFQIVSPPFELEGEWWHSVEQCYQALKFEKGSEKFAQIRDCSPDQSAVPLHPGLNVRDRMRAVSATHGFEVWGLARGKGAGARTDFDAVKLGVMLRANCAKYSSSDLLREDLLATGEAVLKGASSTWDWTKWNPLIHMLIREKLKRGTDLAEILTMGDESATEVLVQFSKSVSPIAEQL